MTRAQSETPSASAESPEAQQPLRPIIQEALRTLICPAAPLLLVDKISIFTQQRNGETTEAFKLWLSDGQITIQAILKRSAHPFVISGDICIGTYVQLDDYSLLQLPRANGQGSIWVFAISDLQPVGHDGRLELSLEEEEAVLVEAHEGEEEETEGKEVRKHDENLEEAQPSPSYSSPPQNSLSPQFVRPQTAPFPAPHLSTPRKRKLSDTGDALVPLDPNLPARQDRARKRFRRTHNTTPTKKTLEEQTNDLRECLIALQSTPTKQRTRAATLTPRSSPSKQTMGDPSPSLKMWTMPAPQPSPSKSRHGASSLRPILRPVKLTPLAELTGAKAKRNSVHDVLAAVTHVNPRILVRKGFPDSREILLMDQSTHKQVHLTIFVDAANFLPQVGTVTLFRNLTTHEWNGGSLKAYVTRCANRQWYITESPGWEWQAETEELKQCFRERPEAKILPDRIWWTERGSNRITQEENVAE